MATIPTHTRNRLILLATSLGLLLALLLVAAWYRGYLRTQVTGVSTGQLSLNGRPPGQYRLLYDARTSLGQVLHTETSFIISAPSPTPALTPTPIPVPSATPTPTPTPTTAPSAAPLPSPTGPVLGTFEMHVSSAPSNMLATWAGFGPSNANLTITGTSQTTPSFTVQTTATFQNDAWQVGPVTTSSLPNGYSAPRFQTDAGSLNGYNRSYVAVKSGGTEAYRMTWTVSGQASDNIGIVLLPRMYASPWRGDKAGLIVKGRHTATPPADNAPYGAGNSELRAMADSIADAIRAMSNGQTRLTYRIEESTFTLPAQCSMHVITDQLVRNLGITDRPSNYQWLIPTLYQNTFTALNSPNCQVPQGLSPNFYGYPLSGPGAWEPNILWPTAALSRTTALHEFGHGIGLTHPGVNALCPGARHDQVRIQDLFEDCGQVSRTPDSNMGPHTTFWWHPIDRAVLGWLKGTQVKLVTSSGTYDVFSDNDDFTSDPAKPLILQLLVMVDGKSDFVYLTVPNPANIAALPNVSEDYRQHYRSGIQLSSGGDLRGGISNTAISINTYTFNTENNLGPQVWKNVIPAGESVRLRWPGTDVSINVVSRSSHQARVQVTYN